MLIKFLQDAAGKGDLDPWDIDVISVIDSFLEQYSQSFGSKTKSKSSYQKNLSETSEAFFAASVLVNLKAQVLESDVFKENSSDFEDDFDMDDQNWIDQEFDLPKNPEFFLILPRIPKHHLLILHLQFFPQNCKQFLLQIFVHP